MDSRSDPILTWREAEGAAAKKMLEWGYADAAVTADGSDGGVDVMSRLAIAQVKFERRPTGRPAIQSLFGARGADTRRHLLFFAHAGYTAQATAYAEAVGVALFQYDTSGDFQALNRHARLLGRPVTTSVATSERRSAAWTLMAISVVSAVAAFLVTMWILSEPERNTLWVFIPTAVIYAAWQGVKAAFELFADSALDDKRRSIGRE